MAFWARLLEIRSKLDTTSYYELLGVEADADVADIVDRYYKLAAKLHPDRFGREKDRERLDALTQVVARMAEAVRILKVERDRAEYDRQLAAGQFRFDPDQRKSPQDELPKKPTALKLYREGLALLERGDREGARKQLTMARSFEPDAVAIAAALERIEASDIELQSSGVPQDVPEATSSALSALLGPPDSSAPTASQAPESTRRAPRHLATLPVDVRLPSSEAVEVFISRDVSRGGMFLFTDAPRPLDTVLEVAVELPDGTQVQLSAKVVRHANDDENGPGMGVEFIEIPIAALEALDRFLPTQKVAPIAAAAKSSAPIPLAALKKRLEVLQSLPPRKLLGITGDLSPAHLDAHFGHMVARLESLRPRCAEPGSDEVLAQMHAAFAAALKSLLSEGAATEDPGVSITDPAIYEDAKGRNDREHGAWQQARAALALLDQRQWKAAREGIEAAIRLLPFDRRLQAAWYVASGHEVLEAGNRALAKTQFGSALEHYPECREALVALKDL